MWWCSWHSASISSANEVVAVILRWLFSDGQLLLNVGRIPPPCLEQQQPLTDALHGSRHQTLHESEAFCHLTPLFALIDLGVLSLWSCRHAYRSSSLAA